MQVKSVTFSVCVYIYMWKELGIHIYECNKSSLHTYEYKNLR